MSALRYYSLIVAGAAALSLGVGWLARRRRKTPEQRERERRQRLNLHGRITDGTVLDVHEVATDGRGATQLLVYEYDVAGVSYHASQDITYLRQYVDVHSCRLGLPASVKYDPHNPGNSIVVAEGWSGLRR